MTDTTQGADSAPEAPVIVHEKPAGLPESMGAREAGRLLSSLRKPKQATQAAPITEAREPAAPAHESTAQADDAAPPQEALGETQVADPAEAPPIEPPKSWTKDEQERFQTFPRELQAYLAEREQERDRDLRRRQNEAAELQKGLQAKQEAADRQKQEYESKVPLVLEALQQQMAGEFADLKTWADVQRMAVEDPVRYSRWDVQQKQLAAFQQEAQVAQQRQADALSEAWKQFAQEQDRLIIEKVPDLSNPEKAPKVREAAAKLLRDTGFTDQELSAAYNGQRGLSLRDHRVQVLIHDAMKYREAKAAVAKPVPKPLPPVQRPGVAPNKGAALEVEVQALGKKLDNARNSNEGARIAAKLIAARRRGAR